MSIFTILISIMGIGLACLFVIVFRYGYREISQIYLKDINRQTTNNLENNIKKLKTLICRFYQARPYRIN